ncbi:dihydrolipoyl dehydrogenase [Actinomycetospora termitidis]|uniref:Dihydrolipoyl dehydrogenase n=1 Tax=Actinomycetospora termitidis TaxID=3053470 RepID=A0ABT7MDK0_9PSEU|nr:dihydrolipoyl dehydrogenase [Actinomycetospora sp. Odt1-22]MDL5158749.1 dihydrolipoyl dehydrogenase [Actinomycetospora sp. Odt1-22]
MADTVVVEVPDIGDFTDVPVIEIHVAVGSEVALDEPLLTLESDKATMDVPADVAGTVTELRVAVGDRLSQGSPILVLTPSGAGDTETSTPPPTKKASTQTEKPGAPDRNRTAPTPSSDGGEDRHVQLLVLGAGPGGYTAAFRAADLGLEVMVVDGRDTLGGVCLNVGCIPSKALLHAAKVIAETKEMAEHGVSFGAPEIDLDRLRDWKDGVVGKLVGGLAGLAKQRKVSTLQGTGRFLSPHRVEVAGADGTTTVVGFDQVIVAAGSEPVQLPFVPHDDPRVLDSTSALELAEVPERLLVLGGGIIGLEMATVYAELGSRITVVELMDQIIPGADKDLVKPLAKHIGARYENVFLSTKCTNVEATEKGLVVSMEGKKAPEQDTFDAVLVAVGRVPNGKVLGLDAAGVDVSDRGFLTVDEQMRTNVGHVFAIGDIVGQPMLAHKAVHEGKVAAEVAAGQKSAFDARVIPSVAYTDPEVAWVGVTETEAKAQGLSYGSGTFPWAASGRSLSLGRSEGSTKVLFDTETDRIIGAGIVGPAAGDLIAEAALAIELGADAADIGLTIHPHPTLSETVGMAAEAFEGTLTDLYLPKRKPAKA